MNRDVIIGIFIPFIGTTLGASMIFFMKDKFNPKLEKVLLGFASGVMIAASIWSLLIPGIEMVEESGGISWLPAAVGFLSGVFFLLILDRIIPHLHIDETVPEGPKTNLKKKTMLMLAVTLHNIPEGMAIGVVYAGLMINASNITVASALALSLGIAIQNFPEGAIISMPMKADGATKGKGFLYGTLSGIVEPIASIITILLTSLVVPLLPYLLSFAAGAMIYVVVEELVPESQDGKHSDLGTIGVAFGFTVMMVLDVALG